MTRVTQLTGDTPEFDRIKAAEAEHEQLKVTINLSPLMQFIIEGGIQQRLHVNRTAAVRELLEAAALDWLDAKGYKTDSQEFQEKYLKWLERKPFLEVIHTGKDYRGEDILEEVEVMESVRL
jgi:hypothetical protein